jgi:alkylation response protein AidB-like acyl-CoA dehydrogenase
VRFAFTDEQRLFQKSMRELCERECPPSQVRAAWAGDTGRSRERWAKLAELGVLGLAAPVEAGGLGGGALDWVLVLEEAGRAALPEPLLETAVVGVPLLAQVAGAWDRAADWIARAAAGEAILAVGLDGHLVADAHVADLILLAGDGDALYAVERAQVSMRAQPSVDGARRLYRVDARAGAVRLGEGAPLRGPLADARDRGALGAAAELVGVAQHLIDATVEYVKVRRQFGQAVGSFQAIKHQLADALVALEFARPVVYRAADSLARALADRATHVSMAKAAASEAALKVARAALQCHGAIGYSFEHDLHLWMKRAWALAAAWGDAARHRARVASAILDGGTAHG